MNKYQNSGVNDEVKCHDQLYQKQQKNREQVR